MTMASEKATMVIGVDESDQSYYALGWTLDHFFTPNSPFKLYVVYAKPVASAVVGLAGVGGSAEVAVHLESDLKKIAARVLETAKEICASKSVSDVVLQVVEGDARNVLCEAVKRHEADILVVGSHSYGVITRAFLGSVSDYCAHHAHCNVMIVKKPKTKH